MMPDQQPENGPGKHESKVRSFFMNPWTIGVGFLLIIGTIGGYGIATTPKKPLFEGTATVVDIQHANKVCKIRLRHEDGIVRKHDMSQYTCKHVTEGEVIEVVAGKYVSQLASQP